MRRALTLCLLLLLAACGRPLTPHEADLASRLFGPTLETGAVRYHRNPLIGLATHRFAARPRTTCRERILPPPEGAVIEGRVAGVALGNHITVRPDLFAADYARDAEGRMSLAAAMFLVHELAHAWQWQNRALTGYSPLRVSREHRAGADPYLFDPDTNPRFLDYGYEQQASLVEEYLCCRVLDPEGARTARLHALLGQVMRPGALPAARVVLPWSGVDPRGICG